MTYNIRQMEEHAQFAVALDRTTRDRMLAGQLRAVLTALNTDMPDDEFIAGWRACHRNVRQHIEDIIRQHLSGKEES